MRRRIHRPEPRRRARLYSNTPTRPEPRVPMRAAMDPRFAATLRRAKKKDDREPGEVSAKLRRRMGPELADIFDSFGPETYSSVVLAIKDVLKENLESGIAGVEAEVKEELGRRGVEEAREHFRSWMDEFVDDVIKSGMDEASVTVEEIGDSLVADFTADGEEEGEDLFDMDDEFEPVEEVMEEDVEPEPEEEVDEEAEGDETEPLDLDLDLEELDFELPEEEGAAAGIGRGRFRRPAPRRRFRGASKRRRATPPPGNYEVLTFRNGRPRFV